MLTKCEKTFLESPSRELGGTCQLWGSPSGVHTRERSSPFTVTTQCDRPSPGLPVKCIPRKINKVPALFHASSDASCPNRGQGLEFLPLLFIASYVSTELPAELEHAAGRWLNWGGKPVKITGQGRSQRKAISAIKKDKGTFERSPGDPGLICNTCP